MLSAASDQLFLDLAPSNVSGLPVYQGELLMKTHGTGCYTSHPEMKTASNTLTINVMPRPALALTGPVAGNLALSWPAYAIIYRLYVTTNLASPIAWSPVTNAVTTQGGTNIVTLTNSPDNRFFQLRSP